MNKPLLVISCPIDCFSGYSERSRDLVKALLDINKYEVKIIPQRWGQTPFGFLDKNNVSHKNIMDHIVKNPNEINYQPDIWIQVTVPNEFQPVGKYNIGITAGIETTICDPSWIEGCNRMNLVLTSSEHSKKVFENSSFEKKDSRTGNIVDIIKLNTPVEVLFEGYDSNIFGKNKPHPDSDIKEFLDEIKESFCFLFVGQWMQGDIGQDRKDVGMLIKTFLETFKNHHKNQPALILKTNSVNFSVLDRENILNKINIIRKSIQGKNIPNIYLIHGELSSEEMNMLYNHKKIKSFVSFTKGEGFGRPLLEFSTTKKPILASNWSGHLDFLKYFIKLNGNLNKVHKSSVVPNMILEESEWFTVDYKYASNILNDVYLNYNNYIDEAKQQTYFVENNFTLDKMKEKIENILENNIPKVIPITIPKLDVNNLPKLKKIE